MGVKILFIVCISASLACDKNNKKIAADSGNILAEKGNGVLQIIKECRMSTGLSPLNIKLKIFADNVILII